MREWHVASAAVYATTTTTIIIISIARVAPQVQSSWSCRHRHRHTALAFSSTVRDANDSTSTRWHCLMNEIRSCDCARLVSAPIQSANDAALHNEEEEEKEEGTERHSGSVCSLTLEHSSSFSSSIIDDPRVEARSFSSLQRRCRAD